MTRSPDIIKQDDDRLDSAMEHLERAIKTLRRVREHPGLVGVLRERASSVESAARCAYSVIREVEWRDGIPSDEDMVRAAAALDAKEPAPVRVDQRKGRPGPNGENPGSTPGADTIDEAERERAYDEHRQARRRVRE